MVVYIRKQSIEIQGFVM